MPPGTAGARESRVPAIALLPTLRRTWSRDGPGTAMCVREVDVQCVLQFTPVSAAGCALHRRASRVIHRLELSASSGRPQSGVSGGSRDQRVCTKKGGREGAGGAARGRSLNLAERLDQVPRPAPERPAGVCVSAVGPGVPPRVRIGGGSRPAPAAVAGAADGSPLPRGPCCAGPRLSGGGSGTTEGGPGRGLGPCSSCQRELGNDPSAGSPTETLLRLLLPLNDQVRPSSPRADSAGTGGAGTDPRASLNRSIGSSDGRCVQRAGT